MTVRCVEPVRTVLLLLIAWFELAQVSSSQAACFSPGAYLAPDEIAKLQANLGVRFVNVQGGPVSDPEIVFKVRDLVTTDKAALKLILEALKFASPNEKLAIGTALGQAAQRCLTTDAGYSAGIQEALATTTDQTAILAFASVNGNVPIGATGGGRVPETAVGAGGAPTGSGTSPGAER
jgi:hypothetical protein